MKTCLNCNQIFDRDNELKVGSSCPILSCCGEVVEIDDNILHTIHLLNEKGYKTASCCSGHTWGYDPYVIFVDSVSCKSISSLPNNFESAIDDIGGVKIFQRIQSDDPIQRQKDIMQAAVDLIEWADQLEPAQSLEVEFFIPLGIDLIDFIQRVKGTLYLGFIDVEEDDDNKEKWIRFMSIIDPKTADDYKVKIKEFAAQSGIDVLIDLDE